MTPPADSMAIAARWLNEAKAVVVFTGAGASAESGIPTFRDNAGLWTRFPPDRFATLPGLIESAACRPAQFAEFLIAVLKPIASAGPNPGHEAVARLEQFTGVTVVTQNIDGLHQRAGSTVVREIHGSILEIVTLGGRFVRLLSHHDLGEMVSSLRRAERGPFKRLRLVRSIRPLVGLSGVLPYRPNVVLFNESMAQPAWDLALEAARGCDLLLVVGTSGLVLPAAMLPATAKSAGARLIDIGFERGAGDLWFRGRSGAILPTLVNAAFA